MSQYDIKDPRVIQMMRERGIYHPALVTKAHSRKGNAESRIMDEIMSQVAKEDQVQQQLNARQEAQQLALGQDQRQFDQSNDQRKLAREGLAADKEKGSEDRRALTLTHVLSDPDAKPEEKQAIREHMLKQAGVTVNKPVDPKAAALARSKGLPEPKQETVGGAPPTNTPTAPTVGREAPPIGPPGTAAAFNTRETTANFDHYDPNTKANYFQGTDGVPRVGGAGDPSVGALAGSKTELLSGNRTKVYFPDGGYGITSSKVGPSGRSALQDYVDKETKEGGFSPSSLAAPKMTADKSAVQGQGGGNSFSPSDLANQTRPDITPNARPGLETAKALATGFGEGLAETADTIGVGAADYASKASGLFPQGVKDFAAGKVTPEQAAAGRPDILPTGRPTLFGGGQGAQELVGTPNKVPPLEATPAPGSQEGGPFSGSIGQITTSAQPPFGSQTPPATVSALKPLTPEEETRRRNLSIR